MEHFWETYQPGELIETNRVISTPSEFARKNLFYVQETGYLKSLRSHVSKRKNLSSYLFLLVLSGSGTFEYMGEKYFLKPNDCIFIDCKYYYSHQSDDLNPWELIWVHFNGHIAAEYYNFFKLYSSTLFHIDNPKDYINIINQLIIFIQNKEKSWELLVSKSLTDLLTICITTNLVINNATSPITDKLQQVRNYINHNYNQKIPLEDLSSKFFISKFYLSREFKKVFGITIIDYITNMRVTAAKELLRFTDKSIEEIAMECGYPDASYFNKVFQKVESITGSEYRKMWR